MTLILKNIFQQLLFYGTHTRIDHLVENKNLMNMITYDKISLNERDYCLDKYEPDSKSVWEDDVGNIFERLNDKGS